jgi:hypothetical protein
MVSDDTDLSSANASSVSQSSILTPLATQSLLSWGFIKLTRTPAPVPAPLCARGGVQCVQFDPFAHSIADFREKTRTS